MAKKGYCCVVNDECLAPAGIQVGGLGGPTGGCDPGYVGECHACGQDVCRNCSKQVRYKDVFGKVRRVRKCMTCIEEDIRMAEFRQARRTQKEPAEAGSSLSSKA